MIVTTQWVCARPRHGSMALHRPEGSGQGAPRERRFAPLPTTKPEIKVNENLERLRLRGSRRAPVQHGP